MLNYSTQIIPGQDRTRQSHRRTIDFAANQVFGEKASYWCGRDSTRTRLGKCAAHRKDACPKNAEYKVIGEFGSEIGRSIRLRPHSS